MPASTNTTALCLLCMATVSVGRAAWAEGAPALVAPVVVVGASPLPGSGVDINKLPSNIQTLTSADLSVSGSANLLGALSDQMASVNFGDNLDSPFQPDVMLRGFEASPVLGTPQGVAVYQNGVRINEAFGDAVNWDLIPEIAIRRVDVMGTDPVYGLNALGGAISVQMKTGFTDPGGEASVSGGSFGRFDAAAAVGGHAGVFSGFLAARWLDDDGWRRFSPSHLREVYADVGARTDRLTVDLGLTVADNHLFGESPAPVQEIAVNRDLVFTSPQESADKLTFATLNLSYRLAPALSVQGAAYVRDFRQGVINGNTTNYTACDVESYPDRLCQGDGATPVVTASGQPIPDLSNGGSVPIGENDFETIRSTSAGGSLQATSTARILGRENHLVVGAGLDWSGTDFASNAEVGVIDAALRVLPSGYFVATPQNTPFNATPVSLRARTTNVGVFASDTFNVTPRLAVTASGRFNSMTVNLTDRLGSNLSGDNRYDRFNPALGFAYELSRAVTAYAGYSEGSRAPNASEIECSNPLIPCLLPSSLASDPPTLRQVVSHTWEAGFRGRFALADGALTWNAGLFRTDVRDDIYGVATSLSAGFFQNISGTRREGVEVAARFRSPRFTAFVSYGHVDATFRSAFLLPSSSSPFQDENGDIRVGPGDHLPGVPTDRLKLGADLEVRHGWSFGGTLALVSGQFYHGDESNQLAALPGHVVLNLHSKLDLGSGLSLFADLSNALDARYATFGTLGDPTGVGAPGVPADGVTNGPGVDNRFQSPAAPIAVYGGLKLRF